MKKIILILVVAAVSLFSSCANFLDREQTDVLTEDRYNDMDKEQTHTAIVNGIYVNLQSYVRQDLQHNYFGLKSFDYLSSLMGNDMVMTGRYGMSYYHYALSYGGQPYVATANRWWEFYTHINKANKILREIDKDTEEETLQQLRAVALGIRGFAYWYLTNLYQFAYYVGAPGTSWSDTQGNCYKDKPCVPIITEETEDYQGRATLDAVYSRLLSDLTTSYDLFVTLDMVKTADPADFDGCVAATYLYRAYMVMQDWDNAIKYADVVMSNFDILDTEADILQGFSDISLKDVVFGERITSDNETTYMSWFSQMDVFSSGYAGIAVWRAGFKPFVDNISSTDIRRQWFEDIKTEKGYDTAGPYTSVKFIGSGRTKAKEAGWYASCAPDWQLGDYIYLRSEEAWYTKAEALAHKGQLSEALAVFEEITETRDPNFTYTINVGNKAEVIRLINEHKRLEFWGEGMEYIDNRRLNIPIDRTDETWTKDANNHIVKVSYTQETLRMRYQLPRSEIQTNPKIEEHEQNEYED